MFRSLAVIIRRNKFYEYEINKTIACTNFLCKLAPIPIEYVVPHVQLSEILKIKESMRKSKK
jgi:hypothetical protein